MAKHTAIRLKNQELRQAPPAFKGRIQTPPVRQMLPDPSQEFFARPRRNRMNKFFKFLIVIIAILLIYYLLTSDKDSKSNGSFSRRPSSSGKVMTYYF